MDYSHDDTGLARQPIGYWSWAAHEATVTHIRAALAENGLTQPPWWVLNQLAGAAGEAAARDELVTLFSGYLDTGADGMEEAVDSLLERGLAAQDDGARLRITPEGRALRDRAYTRVMRARAEIHEGIPDEEFVAALKVLQRMIHNVGATAYHQ
ncbi:MarR family winged helix-turn-helix transcriptional regulator [Streptomyces sp. cmx-18-6]|uniref:MarR family winged helix-turn-helix transcriptional regulator n=1 Tax=Streptomyces sp. cmx-18-6 TaxID=2790930 RepID=UPI003980D433